jgi:hypothetical protein
MGLRVASGWQKVPVTPSEAVELAVYDHHSNFSNQPGNHCDAPTDVCTRCCECCVLGTAEIRMILLHPTQETSRAISACHTQKCEPALHLLWVQTVPLTRLVCLCLSQVLVLLPTSCTHTCTCCTRRHGVIGNDGWVSTGQGCTPAAPTAACKPQPAPAAECD